MQSIMLICRIAKAEGNRERGQMKRYDPIWHPCDSKHLPDHGRLVLFMTRDGESGEVLRWNKYAAWAKWDVNDWRWCYLDEIDRLVGDKAKTGNAECVWREDEYGNWETDCGCLHVFIEGCPYENRHAFCPYCGLELVSVSES